MAAAFFEVFTGSEMRTGGAVGKFVELALGADPATAGEFSVAIGAIVGEDASGETAMT